MYRAKADSSINYEFYKHSMSIELMQKVKMEAELQFALTRNEFFLVYQPKVNIEEKITMGFEALLRWQSPVFGLVSPAQFIPILESSGLIYKVGQWIIKEVLVQMKQGHFQDKIVSINLSPLQFRCPEFIDKIAEQFSQSKIECSQIEFEVTESLLLDDFKQSQEKLEKLRKLGCSIALDDFGTGYSSLSYLIQLPINVLKIDRSFIINIHQYPQQQKILEAIMFMTKKLAISTVIEGVECSEELKIIHQLGGIIIQGYYFSKPLKIDEVSNWLVTQISTRV